MACFQAQVKAAEAELAKISSECSAAMRELKVGKNPVRRKTQAKKAAVKKATKKAAKARK